MIRRRNCRSRRIGTNPWLRWRLICREDGGGGGFWRKRQFVYWIEKSWFYGKISSFSPLLLAFVSQVSYCDTLCDSKEMDGSPIDEKK